VTRSRVSGKPTGTGGAGGEGAAGAGGMISDHPDANAGDAKPDADAVEAKADADAGDAEVDSAQPFCPRSIATCTTTTGYCTPTWADVLADVSGCGNNYDARFTCGAYYVRSIAGGEMVVRSYYDAATGQLVAIVSLSGGGCLAGPPDFALPTCGSITGIPPLCPDASVDGP